MEYLTIAVFLAIVVGIFVFFSKRENKLQTLIEIAEQAVMAVAQMYKTPENETEEEKSLRHALMRSSATERIQSLGKEIGIIISEDVAETLLESGVWVINFAEKKLEEKKAKELP